MLCSESATPYGERKIVSKPRVDSPARVFPTLKSINIGDVMQTAERGQPPTINTADSSNTQSGVNIQSNEQIVKVC